MSRRIEKINELLQQELSKIIHEETNFQEKGIIITVHEVVTSPDLKTAKVKVSFLEGQSGKTNIRKILKKLQKSSHFYHQILNNKLDLKFIPKFEFEKDDSISDILRIDEIIEKEKKKK